MIPGCNKLGEECSVFLEGCGLLVDLEEAGKSQEV